MTISRLTGEPVRRVRRGTVLTLLLLASATPAQAQWVATPYLGINFAGDVETGKGGFGGAIGYIGGLVGFEFDVQRYYHFFKDADVAGLVPSTTDPGGPGALIDLDTDARSFMGNVLAPIRIPGATKLRPYGTAGIGVIRAVFETSYELADTDQNNLGFNVGGGLMYSLNDRLGLRIDVRYFRALVDEDKHGGGFFKDYGFLRATVGVTVGFGRK